MSKKPQISKSQYIKGQQCPKNLWYSLNRKDLTPPVDPAKQAMFDTGNEIGEWAKKYFPGGVEVIAPYYKVHEGVEATTAFIAAGHEAIFEATALHPDGTYSRIDILRKVPSVDAWDMIEVKGSTGVKDYHLDDMSFQYRVFTGAGHRINQCLMMLIDNTYVREGDIEPKRLFKLVDITALVLAKQPEVEAAAPELIRVSESGDEPQVKIGSRCFKPFECDYIHHCWKGVPDYSIYNVFADKKADEITQSLGSYEVKSLPADMIPTGRKGKDVDSHISGELHVEPKNICKFLSGLKYPLYYLDYETIASAIPFFDGTRPFQSIPFQFSLHIEESPGAELKYHGFLHKARTDPRREFLESLINLCGNKGSIIAYNKAFEEGINKGLMEVFPERAPELETINARMADLLVPFKNRWLYHPDQHSSASIKKVLPAFTSLSYSELGISDGQDASNQYTAFMNGKLSPEEQARLWQDLTAYCSLDTLAMKALLEVLKEKSGYSMGAAV